MKKKIKPFVSLMLKKISSLKEYRKNIFNYCTSLIKLTEL